MPCCCGRRVRCSCEPASSINNVSYEEYLARPLTASTAPDRPSASHNEGNSLDDKFRVVQGSFKLRCYGRSHGAALVIAPSTTFEKHEEDIIRLIDVNLAKPPDFDYRMATFKELHVAIEQVRRQMRDRGNAGVDAIWSTLPFCRVVTRVVHSLEVAIIVQPLPHSGAANSPAPPRGGDTSAHERPLKKRRIQLIDADGLVSPSVSPDPLAIASQVAAVQNTRYALDDSTANSLVAHRCPLRKRRRIKLVDANGPVLPSMRLHPLAIASQVASLQTTRYAADDATTYDSRAARAA